MIFFISLPQKLRNMDIETREIAIRSLRANSGEVDGLPRNPRKISKKMLAKLEKSLRESPEMLRLRELIVVPYGEEFVVIAGNQRLEAAKAVGMETLPCKVLPADTSPEKLREYAIKDNLPFGEDDWEVIASDWDTAELEEWGMSVPEEWKGNPTAQDEDFDPDSVKATVCKNGDIWQLGDHRLMCGDSTDAGDVDLLMDGAKADLYITDPPYNVNYACKTKDSLKILNDKMENDSFRHFLRDAFSAANTVMRAGAVFYIWHAGSEGYNFLGACADNGWQVRECLIWAKNSMVLGRQDYQWKHEPCLYGWKDGASHLWASDRKQVTILEFDRPSRSAEHPTMKPVALFAYQISNNTHEGDLVFDSFGGSGTTLIAAEQLNRKCYMMELDPHYCDVIIARWEKLTGKKATKIN